MRICRVARAEGLLIGLFCIQGMVLCGGTLEDLRTVTFVFPLILTLTTRWNPKLCGCVYFVSLSLAILYARLFLSLPFSLPPA